MRRTIFSATALGLLAWCGISFAADTGPNTPAEVKAKQVIGVVGTGTTTVTAVDREKREVTLKDADGFEVTLPVGAEARNFDQIKVGDNVDVSYSARLVVKLEPGPSSASGIIKTVETSRSPEGAMPYGMVTRNVEIFAQVVSVDPAARTVTLMGNRGELTLPVADDVVLGVVKVGDRVKAYFKESVTIAVIAPPS